MLGLVGRSRDSTGEAFAAAARELKSVATVDGLIGAGAIRRPTLVKIDVDGIEPQILAGMRELLTSGNRPRSLQVEVGPDTLEAIDTQLAAWNYVRESRHFSKGGRRRLARGEAETSIPHNVIYASAV